MTTPADNAAEAALARLAAAGDVAAFESLMGRTHDAVRNFIWMRCRGASFSEEDRDEVVNSAFARLIRALPSFRFECTVRTFACKIAWRLAINRVHYNRRRLTHETVSLDRPISEDSDMTPADFIDGSADVRYDVELAESGVESFDAIARLPENHREVLELRAGRNMSYEQISAELGLKVGTVKSRIARARESLRLIISPANPSPQTVAALNQLQVA